MAGQARQGGVRLGLARSGRAGSERRGKLRSVRVCFGKVGHGSILKGRCNARNR